MSSPVRQCSGPRNQHGSPPALVSVPTDLVPPHSVPTIAPVPLRPVVALLLKLKQTDTLVQKMLYFANGYDFNDAIDQTIHAYFVEVAHLTATYAPSPECSAAFYAMEQERTQADQASQSAQSQVSTTSCLERHTLLRLQCGPIFPSPRLSPSATHALMASSLQIHAHCAGP